MSLATINFTQEFRKFAPKTNPTLPDDICIASSATYNAFLVRSKMDVAASLASGARYPNTYDGQRGLRFDDLTQQQTINPAVVQDIARHVSNARMPPNAVTPTTAVAIAFARAVTMHALSKLTITNNLNFWGQMYDNSIIKAIDSVPLNPTKPFSVYENACIAALQALPQMATWAPLLTVSPGSIPKASMVLGHILYTLNALVVLDKYLHTRATNKRFSRKFYQQRCDDLARRLYIVWSFTFVYNAASTDADRESVFNAYRDVLSVAGMTTSTSIADVTSSVKQAADMGMRSATSVKRLTKEFDAFQMQLQGALVQEEVSTKNKRKALISVLAWWIVMIAVSAVIATEVYRGNTTSGMGLSAAVVVAVSVTWIVSTFTKQE